MYTFDWLDGFVTSIVLYTALSWFIPDKATNIEHTIYGHDHVVMGSGSSDVESTGVKGEKDFANVDDVDIGTGFHTNQYEKHVT